MDYISFSPLHVNHLTIEGIYSLNKSTIELAKPVSAVIGPIAAAALSLLESTQQTLGLSMNQAQKSALSSLIKGLDKSRDGELGEIKGIVRTYIRSSDETKKSAASTLHLFLTPYKGVASLPINIETGSISEMVDKYKSNPELVAAATTLGVSTQFVNLETKNNELNDVYHNRNADYAAHDTSATDVKPAVIAAYMQFCTAIEQAHHYTPSDTLTAVFNKMDELRKKYHALEGKKGDASGDAKADN
ncbi:DUF6261 family protein [Parabacteroides sp. FAFU027]|uniref:DUF6261 family protein n=1 Tax=Parabacteroides sp. FAFU027 TaxID=2922715 RepID=UPI001FAF3DBE|nr:DUF6261 family protein [Parabacteroides sp. FAFU027]